MVKKTIPKEHKQFRYLDKNTKEFLDVWQKGQMPMLCLEDVLTRVHSLKPKLIFLTQTSSIPYGFAFKEAWKEVYPKEELPKFLTIDIKNIRAWSRLSSLRKKTFEKFYGDDLPYENAKKNDRFPNYYSIRRKIHKKFHNTNLSYNDVGWDEINEAIREDPEFEKFFDEQIEKRANRSASKKLKEIKNKLLKCGVRGGDSIIVLDEQVSPKGIMSNSLEKKYIHMGSLNIAKKVLETAVKEIGEDIKVDGGYISGQRLPIRGLGPWISGTQTENYVEGKHKLMSLRRYSGVHEREISKSNVNYLKGIGREAGRRIRAKRNLENKLTLIITSAMLVMSFLFSSGITGNVVGNSNQSQVGIIGIILFILGLGGMFIYLKRKIDF